MSQDALIAERYAPEDGEPTERAIAGPLKRLRAKPLLPEAGAAGAPLTAVIGVISFLATLSLAAFLAIAAAASEWTGALNASFTVQVKGADAQSISTSLEEAERVLRDTPGVISVAVTPPDEAAQLLEPWLGASDVADYLNVPALIDVRAEKSLRNDLGLLSTRLAAAAPGAVIDDHGQWRDRLATGALTAQILAFGVFLLILAAACAISAFAARAGLAANADVVSLLHLVGATDGFIANEVQRRFVVLALRGSLAGLVAALATLSVAAFGANQAAGESLFLPEPDLTVKLAVLLAIVPIAVSLATAVSARATVLRALRSAY